MIRHENTALEHQCDISKTNNYLQCRSMSASFVSCLEAIYTYQNQQLIRTNKKINRKIDTSIWIQIFINMNPNSSIKNAWVKERTISLTMANRPENRKINDSIYHESINQWISIDLSVNQSLVDGNLLYSGNSYKFTLSIVKTCCMTWFTLNSTKLRPPPTANMSVNQYQSQRLLGRVPPSP